MDEAMAGAADGYRKEKRRRDVVNYGGAAAASTASCSGQRFNVSLPRNELSHVHGPSTRCPIRIPRQTRDPGGPPCRKQIQMSRSR
jgi:hypothetical protein